MCINILNGGRMVPLYQGLSYVCIHVQLATGLPVIDAEGVGP